MATARSRKSSSTRKKTQSSSDSMLSGAAAAAARTIGRTVGAVAARVAPSTPHDPIDQLERDHRRLEKLLKKGEETTARASKGRKELLATLTAELVAHEKKEETILYPALKRHGEAREIVLEGYQEHHVADVLVQELHDLPPTDERWGAKFKVLKENIEHHIEEEEGTMFKQARSMIGRAQLESIGTRMETIKADDEQPVARRKRGAP
jgi:hemerythrin-like domain-containing protein